ncbi:sperm flagellar protein 1 isoform X1 [Archocentrus centrarchus]|uniref:sperm flagellar protein 1 isoform X1 n=1 Tax=Archocentrus centrarchus TaxID=63155 RepID=UPI0011E9F218|nr:sperm flagellar protein 1 isoform X1 [Archocentrus centrarchus]
MDRELNEEELQDLFAWIDKIPLSRPKRHITRDFSDAVMAAEVVKHFFPKLVDLHNYVPASSTQQKLSNWKLLNRKVFSKLIFHVPEETLKKITLSTAGAVVPVLSALREKIDKKLEDTNNNMPDVEYYDTRDQEKPHADLLCPELSLISPRDRSDHSETQRNLHLEASEIHQTEIRLLTQLAELKKDEKNMQKNSKVEHAVKFYSAMDPTFQQILKEKEKAIMSLMETLEILQMKVNKLEHLVHLKDIRIQDLTQHLEMYKARGNTH